MRPAYQAILGKLLMNFTPRILIPFDKEGELSKISLLKIICKHIGHGPYPCVSC